MDETLRKEIIAEARRWLAAVPNQNEPFYAEGGRDYTPREWVSEVENLTPFGKTQIERIAKVAKAMHWTIHQVFNAMEE